MADKKSHIVSAFFVVQSYFAQTLHHNERYHSYSLKMKGHKNYEQGILHTTVTPTQKGCIMQIHKFMMRYMVMMSEQ